MVKTIHCIKAGNMETGDFENRCIDSWKKVYPDFEIKIWTDKEIIPLIQDCLWAVTRYSNGEYAFTVDYVKLVILHAEGGLYMDTDVICIDRLPDSIFDKAFTSWDPGFDTYWSQNGTCLYCEPGNPIIAEMIDLYKSLDPEKSVDNTVVETVMRKHGLDYRNTLTCRFTNQELEDITVYNSFQFGCLDYFRNIMTCSHTQNSIFFIHCRMKSWMTNSKSPKYVFYAMIDKDTDVNELSQRVNSFIEMRIPKNSQAVMVFVLNRLDLAEQQLCIRLNMKLDGTTKDFVTLPLGENLDTDTIYRSMVDFISRRFDNIKFCRNIMEGDFRGGI